ncbi:MFS general substrate transporter [Aulographum hederae CBS 113979]|uniref:MFS general substrate transporter n=1 Tax=Aulographum hederae CBS 113979 TaxID=1176131 RepID=A0A6G1GP77_9PEZI|nr:MFS general substrate transporter [Aulographum hederae CBS 113979]
MSNEKEILEEQYKEPEEVIQHVKPDIDPQRPTSGDEEKVSPSSDQEPTKEQGEKTPDIELARIPSGPAYSAFTHKQKQFIVFMVACAGFFSPLSANIYFPALNTLAADLHVSETLINLTLTSYMIFQGLAPTFYGDLADIAGRRPAYIVGFVIYIAACIGIALSDSYAALFVLRCLQSSGSSGTIALGSGVVADIATSSERGTWMGWATSGPMLAPAIAPVLGGILSQFLGWPSIFWFLTILAGIFFIPLVLLFPETGRNVVGDGSIPPQGWNMSLLTYLQVRKARKTSPTTRPRTVPNKQPLRWPNPLNVLRIVFQKQTGLLLAYNSLVYTAFYDVIASTPYLLRRIYAFNDLEIGLCFLPFGVGCLFAPTISGRLCDRNYRRHAARLGIPIDRKRGESMRDLPIERIRLEVAAPLLAVGTATILCYGWVMYAETHLTAPMVLHFVMGLTLMGGFNATSVLIVDLYLEAPATATASNNLVRCLVGAGGTAVIVMMIEGMGVGWCFTFIAGVVAAASPILWVLVEKGPRWREERRVRDEERRRKRQMEAEEKLGMAG